MAAPFMAQPQPWNGTVPIVGLLPASPAQRSVGDRNSELERQLAGANKNLADLARRIKALEQQNGGEDEEDLQKGEGSSLHSDDPEKNLFKAGTQLFSEEDMGALNEYVIEESMWDCAIFVSADFIPWSLRGGLVLGLFLNGFVQLYFCWIVYTAMLNQPLDDDTMLGLLHFRTGIAHDVRNADHVGRQSLAALLCSDDQKTPISGQKANLLEEITGARECGINLCSLALFCWITTMFGELEASFRFFAAMANVPRGKTKFLKTRDGNTSLKSISNVHFWFCMLVGPLPRLLVACVLLYFGSYFLIITQKLEDLVLNAVALAFIMDIDELLFRVLNSARVKGLQRTIEPLKLPARGVYSVGVGVKFLIILGAMVIIWVCYLSPFYARINMAYEIMCGGNRDFIYTVNPATGLVEATPSMPEASSTLSETERAVLQLARPQLARAGDWVPEDEWLDLVNAEAKDLISTFQYETDEVQKIGELIQIDELTPGSTSFNAISATSVSSVSDLASDAVCKDQAVTQWVEATTLAALKRITGQEVAGCEDVVDLCWLKNMTELRALCPETCGCWSVLNTPGGFFATSSWGCPGACMKRFERRLHNTSLLCMDSSAEDFSRKIALVRYMKGALQHLASHANQVYAVVKTATRSEVWGKYIKDQQAVLDWILQGGFQDSLLAGKWDILPGLAHPRGLTGCSFWTSWEVESLYDVSFCNDRTFRTIRPFCPVSCGCQQDMEPECPQTCKR